MRNKTMQELIDNSRKALSQLDFELMDSEPNETALSHWAGVIATNMERFLALQHGGE